MNLRTILLSLINDRVVQAGTGSSTVSIAGAAGMAHDPMNWATSLIGHAQPWIAFFAALFGGLSAFATFVYVCLKIRRLLNQPDARE